ncbi:hypothetical protein EMCRGX_G002062 [Ephydatia muelleri]
MQGVSCYSSTHERPTRDCNSLSRQTFRSPGLPAIKAVKPGECGRDSEHHLVVGPQRPVKLLVWSGKLGNDGDMHGRTGPASSRPRSTPAHPRYPQSNGQAERAVQTVKKLLRTSGDLHLSVLNYNATPMPWCGFSPSELLMGRKVRTTVPQVAEQFCPNWPFLDQFYRKNQEFKKQQEKQYNRRHQTRPQLELEEGDEVWINTDNKNTRGYVTSPGKHP